MTSQTKSVTHSTKYENDFNAYVNYNALQTFFKSYSLNSLIKQPTCFKNPISSSFIDLMLTNKPPSFQTKFVIEAELSEFHRMTLCPKNALSEGSS